jgi:hypothetical protein
MKRRTSNSSVNILTNLAMTVMLRRSYQVNDGKRHRNRHQMAAFARKGSKTLRWLDRTVLKLFTFYTMPVKNFQRICTETEYSGGFMVVQRRRRRMHGLGFDEGIGYMEMVRNLRFKIVSMVVTFLNVSGSLLHQRTQMGDRCLDGEARSLIKSNRRVVSTLSRVEI